MRLYDATAVSFSLFISRVSLFPSSLSSERVSERGTVLQPSARLFLPLSSSYLLLAFALLFSKLPCGVSFAMAAFWEDLIPLFFCVWAAWILWIIYVRGWVS